MRLYHVAKPGNNKHYTTSPSLPMTNIISRRQASQRHKLYRSQASRTTNIISRRQASQRQTLYHVAKPSTTNISRISPVRPTVLVSLVVRASASNDEVCLFEPGLSHTKDL
ncbi:hypothetical protein CHS0354_001008 [Potamilus streckersoni]|uniref:Uncharacterized protein n=1 Tax=Potamilus streckersoni TaxID=2493646 RepID=A0AAE0VQ65_9BIVA|nr:hypothetical protein CHS0354_001008 [Potamilus streckersoni]